MTACLHPSKVIDGFYWSGGKRVGIGWTCLTQACRTSGAIPINEATRSQMAEAYLAEDALRPESPEMMVGR
jgi:hypothetical protein